MTMLLEASTDNLYDPVVELYHRLFHGERECRLRLTIKEGFDPRRLTDFLALVEEGGRDFDANIDLEVLDEARVLQ